MNLMESDRSFVRQRNEELLREMRTQQLGKQLRARREVTEDGLCEGREVLSM